MSETTATELLRELSDLERTHVRVMGYDKLLAALEDTGHKPEDYCQVAACPGCDALADARAALLKEAHGE